MSHRLFHTTALALISTLLGSTGCGGNAEAQMAPQGVVYGAQGGYGYAAAGGCAQQTYASACGQASPGYVYAQPSSAPAPYSGQSVYGAPQAYAASQYAYAPSPYAAAPCSPVTGGQVRACYTMSLAPQPAAYVQPNPCCAPVYAPAVETNWNSGEMTGGVGEEVASSGGGGGGGGAITPFGPNGFMANNSNSNQNTGGSITNSISINNQNSNSNWNQNSHGGHKGGRRLWQRRWQWRDGRGSGTRPQCQLQAMGPPCRPHCGSASLVPVRCFRNQTDT